MEIAIKILKERLAAFKRLDNNIGIYKKQIDSIKEALDVLEDKNAPVIESEYYPNPGPDDDISLFSHWKETDEEKDAYHSGTIKHFGD